MLECLAGLVGLSAQDIACFKDTKPSGWNVSESGYFVNDTDFGVGLAHGCDMAGWALLSGALGQAGTEFASDLGMALRNRHQARFAPYSGLIGKIESTGPIPDAKQYFGHRLRPNRIRGGKFVLKAIWIGVTVSGTYNFTVKSNEPGAAVIPGFTGEAVANTWAKIPLTTAISMKSASAYTETLEWLVYAERQGGSFPLNNIFACCGNRPGHLQFAEVGGFMSDDVSTFDLPVTAQGCGLALEGYFCCDETAWICDLAQVGECVASDLVARALQFRAASIAITRLLESNQISPCTLVNVALLNEKRNFLNSKYSEYLTYLAENLPRSVTDCWACKDTEVFKIGKILI